MSPILERGDLFFFYRPRVAADRVADLRDVQRFFLVLEPDGTELFRRLVVGQKRLPDPSSHERTWAFVAEVAARPEEVRGAFERRGYDTKTGGGRRQPAGRGGGGGGRALGPRRG